MNAILTRIREKTQMLTGDGSAMCSAFVVFFSLMLLMNVIAPRFWGIGVPVFGLLLFLAHIVCTKTKPALPKIYAAVSVVLLIVASLSALWSVLPELVWDRVDSLAPILLGGGLLLSVALSREFVFRRIHVWALVACAFSGLFLIAVDLFFDMALHRVTHGLDFEQNVPLFHLNRSLCGFALLLCPVMYLARHRGISHWVSCGLFTFFGVCAFFSDSQSAQLCAILCAAFFFLYQKFDTLLFRLLLGSVTVFTLAFPWVWPPFFDSFKGFDPYAGTSYSPKDLGFPFKRAELWAMISESAQKRPLLGHGVEATREMMFEQEKIYLGQNKIKFLHPHSMVLQLWHELGLLGAMLLAAALALVLRAARSLPMKIQPYAMTSFVAFFVIANVAYGIWQSWFVGLVVFLLALYTMFKPDRITMDEASTPADPE